MVAALELYFDSVAEQRIRVLWRALSAAGVATMSDVAHGRHRPHVSLVACDVLDPVAVAQSLGDLSAAPLRLTFGHVGQFPGGVLWLGPAPTAPLLALHAEVTARLDAGGVPYWPLYRPGAWVPHCTLSMTARGDAIATGARIGFDYVPLEATVRGAAVADHSRDVYHPLPGLIGRE
jgi:hypothetical protein